MFMQLALLRMDDGCFYFFMLLCVVVCCVVCFLLNKLESNNEHCGVYVDLQRTDVF